MAGAPKAHELPKDRGAKSTCAGYCYTAYQRIHSGFTIDIVLKFYRQIKAFAGTNRGAFFDGEINSVIFSQNY